MKRSMKIGAASVAVLCLLAFSGVIPAMAAIPASMQTPGALSIVSTNLPLSVTCVPDGVATTTVSVLLSDSGGSSTLNPGSTITVTAPNGTLTGQTLTIAPIDSTTAYANATLSFPYTWQAGAYSAAIFVWDSANNRLNGANNAPIGIITYQPMVGVTVSTPSIAFGTVSYGAANGPQNVAWHNSANTALNVAASGPNWAGSGSSPGSIPISSLTANSIALSNSGTQVASNVAIGSGAQTMGFTENMPVYSSGIAGQSFTTNVTLTGSVVAS